MSHELTPEKLLATIIELKERGVGHEQWLTVMRDYLSNPDSPIGQYVVAQPDKPIDATLPLLDYAENSTDSFGADSGPTLSLPHTPTPTSDNHRPQGFEVPQRSAVIGNYKLLQKLGEGGMGSVWMAEQERPVRRRVALKLIKTGLDDQQVLARFEAERQALAIMDHPNIARVLDAGTTSAGQPFFAMELVPGIPITEYCDNNCLSLQQRLELFVPVCHAVQHAHQKGIIHRDLKPSNILVTVQDGGAVSKVIDFGLAKALQQQTRLCERTLFTEFGQVVGTLRYMSPEQAELSSLDIDTRADIYSLGVILYELLAGSTPLEREFVSNEPVFKVLEAIRSKEPPRPSSRLGSASNEAITTISQQRQIDARKYQRILKGELDWIAMKALEKDRTRRYATALDLATDLERYLHGDAVQARPPSSVYRLRKFSKRHRGLLISSSLIALILCGGLIGLGWFSARANRFANEKRLAELNSQKLQTALETAKKERQRAEEAQHESEQSREIALEAAERARRSENIATVARAEAEQAAKQQQQMAEDASFREAQLKANFVQLLQSLFMPPRAESASTNEDGRLALARRLYAVSQDAKLNQGSGALVAVFACGLINLGYPDQGRVALRNAAEAYRNAQNAHGQFVAWCNDSARVLLLANHWQLAEPLLRESQKLASTPQSSNDFKLLVGKSLLGEVLIEQSKFEEAEVLLLDAYRGLEKSRKNTAVWVTATRDTLQRITLLYTRWNRPDEIKRWRSVQSSTTKP